jgi:hypothetical protein
MIYVHNLGTTLLSPSEKSGGCSHGTISHRHFEDFVHANALIDLGFNGYRFNWSNHQQGRANIREILDRGLANQNWVHLFPNSLITIFLLLIRIIALFFCPLLVLIRILPKPFHFEAFWTKDLSSHDVVAQALSPDVQGSPAFSVSRRWKNTKICSQVLASASFWEDPDSH